MGIFDKIKELWTEYRTPTRIAPPTTQAPGTIGGTQVVQTPPSMRQPTQVHSTTPTVRIHGKEPSKKRRVKKVVHAPIVERVKDVIPKIDVKVAEIQKKATLQQKIQLSRPSEAILTASQKGAEMFRTAGERFTKIETPLVHPINIQVGATLLESGARTVEMAGMIPAGTETLARHPELVKPALAVGLYGSTVGMGKALKEDPLQTISDIAVMGTVFRGAGRVVPKPKIPYTIARKATVPEGVLLKGEIKAPKVDIQLPKTKAVTEYIPSKVETFVGKVKGEVADLYVRVPESEIGMLKSITSEKAPYQVMTGKGKFTVIDQPTYLDIIPSTKLKLAGETKLTLREQIASKVPYEIIPKVDLTQVRLQTSIVPERVMIPEFLRTIDVTPTQTRAGTFEFADTMKTKWLLERGKTSQFKDFTEPFKRKDIQEMPYTRDVSIGIGEESALLGRVLSKQERGLVRDTIIKERIEFEPVKTQYTPPRTDFSTVGSVTGQQLIMKPKAASTTFKEPSTIQTINLETDIRMPDTMAQIVPRTKTAPTTFKEPVDAPVFDVEAMFKRPTYEQFLSKTKVKTIGKTKPTNKRRLKTVFAPMPTHAKITTTTVQTVDSIYEQPISAKQDFVTEIGIPQTPIPITRIDTGFKPIIETGPVTETQPKIPKTPPKAQVIFDYPPIKPIVTLPKKKKDKDEKKTRKQQLKSFQWFINNPIASPFGNSVGKVNK
ncbi:MAG: hypothetical protein KAQ89_05305 [Planctomycetes bacterium]|nr:hypothetical protein [Planctomycetota bacterium]